MHIGDQRPHGVGRRIAGDEESDASRRALARERQARFRIFVGADDDVLEEIAEGAVERALQALIHFDVVRDRTLVRHGPGRFGQDHSRALTVLGAGGVELFK